MRFLLPNLLFVKLFVFSLFLSQAQMAAAQCQLGSYSTAEAELARLLNQYRVNNGLDTIPYSKSLATVAQYHVQDLAASPPVSPCNMHSWSSANSLWSSCCYTPDHAQAQCMWDKPEEISGGVYNSYGYEVSARSTNGTPASYLSLWQGSSAHNAVLLNTGTWLSYTWRGFGVGIYGGYAVMWFGTKIDPAGPALPCVTTSIHDANTAPDWSFGPNPAVNSLNIKLPIGASGLVLRDLLGRTLGEWPTEPNASETTLDISHLPAGTYALSLTHQGRAYTRLVVVQR